LKRRKLFFIAIFLPLVVFLMSNCGNQVQKMETSMNNSNKNQPTELLLPAPLFFLENGQIWQLNKDGKSSIQVANEADPIIEFDLSVKGDRLVYVSGNQLIFNHIDSSDRKIIQQSQTLVSHMDQLEIMNDESQIKNAIRSPLISADGSKIAFVENGLRLKNVENETSNLIWENSSDDQDIIYRLLSWSPDEKNYLVTKYVQPLQSIYQQSIGLVNNEIFVTLPISSADGFAWYAGGQALILSNSKAGHPGSLMRCELEEFKCVEIAEFEPARWYYFYAVPTVVNNSSIHVFMAAASDPTLIPDTYKLIRVNLDGSNRQELISGEFPVEIGLWTSDGNGVVIQLSKTYQIYPAGAVLWVDLVQKKIYELPITNVTQMKWGVSEEK